MLRSTGVRRNERQVDFVFLSRRESDFGLLRFFFNALDCIRLFSQINAGILLKFLNDPIHDPRVPVVAAQVGIAVGRFDFEHAVTDFEHGNIEGAAA